MYKHILRVLIIFVLLFVLGYLVDITLGKKIETFLVKNIRSGNSIINDSRKSLVNKHHVKLGQKVLTSRWFKVLEAYPNSRNQPIGENYPTFSAFILIHPKSVEEAKRTKTELIGATQTFVAAIKDGDLNFVQALRKDDSEDISFDKLIVTKSTSANSIEVWLHTISPEINNINATILISQPFHELDTINIRLWNSGNSPIVKAPLDGNLDEFPDGDWPKNWEEQQLDLVKKQVSKIYTNIHLRKNIMNLEERVDVTRTNINNARNEINNIKEKTKQAVKDSEVSANLIDKATYDTTLLSNKQTALKVQLPYCRNKPFNINVTNPDDSKKCCPDGWVNDPSLSDSEKCITKNYPYKEIDGTTPYITCSSVGGVVKSIGEGSQSWACERFPERQVTMVMNSDKPELCGGTNKESTIKYSGYRCGESNNIQWDDVHTLEVLDPQYSKDSCGKTGEWNRSMLVKDNKEKINNYLGECGKSPNLVPELPNNISDLNTKMQTSTADLKTQIETLRKALEV